MGCKFSPLCIFMDSWSKTLIEVTCQEAVFRRFFVDIAAITLLLGWKLFSDVESLHFFFGVSCGISFVENIFLIM